MNGLHLRKKMDEPQFSEANTNATPTSEKRVTLELLSVFRIRETDIWNEFSIDM